MHTEPWELVKEIKSKYPHYFHKKKVLEVGSLDINGTVRGFFENCWYTGLDIGPGKGVDLILPIHELKAKEEYDVVISTEMLEHDIYWQESIKQMFENLKSGGMLIFTCAGPSRQEHGTSRTTAGDSPYTNDYYENRTVEDLLTEWKPEKFTVCHCYYLRGQADLVFWGIKK